MVCLEKYRHTQLQTITGSMTDGKEVERITCCGRENKRRKGKEKSKPRNKERRK
jgi:hypothetical protein